MTPTDDLRSENKALRERFSTLNEAILRINASLDLDTVLKEAVASGCELTGARFGIITPVDEAGVLHDSVFWGFSAEQQRETAAWPDKVPMFEHLSRLPGPFRVANLGDYIRSVGLEPAPTFSGTFQYAPMRHRGVHVGHFYLAGRADEEEFSDEDEEVLALFASQVATAVANARAHHGERRVRARLEALVETSPVGVVVFDLQSRRPVSFNREARRIMESLRLPRRPPEQLLDLVMCRRADDREISLGELPLAQQAGNGGTVWAASNGHVRGIVELCRATITVYRASNRQARPRFVKSPSQWDEPWAPSWGAIPEEPLGDYLAEGPAVNPVVLMSDQVHQVREQ